MTTPNNQPTPPDGMRLLTPEEYGKPTPEGTMFLNCATLEWVPREINFFKTHIGAGYTYAIPINPQSESEQPRQPRQARQICGDQQCPQRVTHYEGECPNCCANNPPADGNPSYEQRLWDEYYGQLCADNSTRNIYETADLVDDMMAERAKRMKGDK